jgi:hypothetical protein
MMRLLRTPRLVFWSLLVGGFLLVIGAAGCSSDGSTTQPDPTVEDPGTPDLSGGERGSSADIGIDGENGFH